jgi:hypothetical protein
MRLMWDEAERLLLVESGHAIRHNVTMSAQRTCLSKILLVPGNFVGLLTVALLGVGAPEGVDAATAFDVALQPTVRCIYGVLKSSNKVRSVSLYSVDGSRFAIEYAFRNKENQLVVSDIEFFGSDAPFTATDKIPREVSMEVANEAQELERKLNLNSKCGLRYEFDNLYPEASARADWEKIGWPWEHRRSGTSRPR